MAKMNSKERRKAARGTGSAKTPCSCENSSTGWHSSINWCGHCDRAYDNNGRRLPEYDGEAGRQKVLARNPDPSH